MSGSPPVSSLVGLDRRLQPDDRCARSKPRTHKRRIAENTARIPYPYRVTDAEKFIGGANKNGEAAFLITLRDRTVVGACGIMFHHDDAPELGYWLGVPYWNQGYATEALHALIDYAFTDLAHETLQAGARVTNPASRRVLEKCGFQWTGVGSTASTQSNRRRRSIGSG